MCYGIIYKATNLINGKVYIGQTTKPLRKRVSEHRKKIGIRKQALYLAFEKYGFNNFSWSIIDNAISLEELNSKEIFWISQYNSYGKNGYNMTIGGDSTGFGETNMNYGKKLSEEHKRNISISQSGEKHHQFGKPLSDEHRKNLSISRTGKVLTDEHRKNISQSLSGEKNGFYNKTHTQETKSKMSESKIGTKSKHARAVLKFTPEGDFLERFDTAKFGADSVGSHRSQISVACKKRYKHKGYIWIYEDEYEGEPIKNNFFT